ncbi:unnamed protein product [Cylindrotheca closterium]|uniref:Potassium channel domain-containing protein n=1 Tax=Cylindrotheca closterium TaxID=2856 RepID=A0AAD2FVM9_9STRA|nr:unnamed protein product [Cylindrotheca closterium]
MSKPTKGAPADSAGSSVGGPEASNDDAKVASASILGGLGKVSSLTQNSLGKATDLTTKHLTKATDVTTKHLTKATDATTKQIGSALKQSEEAYETSQWCFLARFIGQFPKYFPRVFSLTFGVLVPLWFLILISAGFGIILADYEATEERISNHDILASRARINKTFVERNDIGGLPVDCFIQYLSQSNRSLFEERINLYLLASSRFEELEALNETNMTDPYLNFTTVNGTETIQGSTNIFSSIANANATNVTLGLDSNSTANHTIFSPIMNYTLDDVVTETEQDILMYITQCQAKQTADIQIYLEDEANYGESSTSSLSFNWNRCYAKEINEVWGSTRFVFFPPPELIEASHPSQQEAAVETEFVRILNESEKACLGDGGDEEECFEQALEDAAGAAGDVCHDNVEGTSWFFFTIMTTVGYGNQAPVTDEGRLLIYIAGIACLILFAAVLGSSGYIILAIFDDFVDRFRLSRFLQYPSVGVLLWGGIWIGWAYGIATDADYWWAERLPDFDVDRDDSLWFAFISTSTIGLGDYFLQPEVMFASDALKFSAAFLIGFVFLSTFLNKIGEFLFSILPKRDNSLETRLQKTNIFFWKHWPCMNYIKSDYLRSIGYNEDSEETDETLDKLQPSQNQIERVKLVKSLLQNQSLPPPLNTMHADNEEEKTMEDLLDEEELILKALLESIPQRRNEMRDATRGASPAVKAKPLMTGLVPLPDDDDDVLSA